MSGSNEAQIELWRGRVGEKWAALQAHLDAMLVHATTELQSRAGPVSGLKVLDIGCGTGETCMIWQQGGAAVTGVDVSTPMLAVAASRTAGKVTLINADASVWSGAAPFDLAVSRLGVMFFADPVAAFANIASNLRSGGRLLFVCWRAVRENQWAYVPFDAIRDLLPEPQPAPDAPGPYALSDKERLREILGRAGFSPIGIDAFDFPLCLAVEGGAETATCMAMQVGPTGVVLAEASDELRAAAAARIWPALAAYERDGAVTLGGAIWVVDAIRGR